MPTNSTTATIAFRRLIAGRQADGGVQVRKPGVLSVADQICAVLQMRSSRRASRDGTGNSGGFADTFYWSSSEHNSTNAWLQYFNSSGLRCHDFKARWLRVRAARAV